MASNSSIQPAGTTETQKPQPKISRRTLIASVAVLGGWGALFTVVGAHFSENEETVTPLPDDERELPEASTIRPARAYAQGELVPITHVAGEQGVQGNTMGITGFLGTMQYRVTGSWLYETAEAFEREEKVSIANNYVDLHLKELGEKERAYDEAHPDEAKKKQEERITNKERDSIFNAVPERVDDLNEELDYRRNGMLYRDDGSQYRYRITTQDLLDAGYKLLSFDLEIESVNAIQTTRSDDSGFDDNYICPCISFARGSDIAVFEFRYYLLEGEIEPTKETYDATNSYWDVYLPQGESKRIHMVYAVSPRSLKGELSLFVGAGGALTSPVVDDNVALLAIDPVVVS